MYKIKVLIFALVFETITAQVIQQCTCRPQLIREVPSQQICSALNQPHQVFPFLNQPQPVTPIQQQLCSVCQQQQLYNPIVEYNLPAAPQVINIPSQAVNQVVNPGLMNTQLIEYSVPVQEYPVEVCQGLAEQVQSMVVGRLLENSKRKPLFNQIAGPLLNDLAFKSGCPVCGGGCPRSNLLSQLPLFSGSNLLQQFCR